jgi:hypothetical protein
MQKVPKDFLEQISSRIEFDHHIEVKLQQSL